MVGLLTKNPTGLNSIDFSHTKAINMRGSRNIGVETIDDTEVELFDSIIKCDHFLAEKFPVMGGRSYGLRFDNYFKAGGSMEFVGESGGEVIMLHISYNPKSKKKAMEPISLCYDVYTKTTSLLEVLNFIRNGE